MKSDFLIALAVFALPALALSAGPAQAQVSSLKGLDSGAPIDFDAAHLEILDAERLHLVDSHGRDSGKSRVPVGRKLVPKGVKLDAYCGHNASCR